MKTFIFASLLLVSFQNHAQYEITPYFFPDLIDDVELNTEDNLIYVVQGNFDHVSVRNLDMTEVDQLYVGNRPYKITFNTDNSAIYSTLKQQGKVSRYVISTQQVTEWDISQTLLTDEVYDIAYGKNGMVFVSFDRIPWANSPFATTVALDTNSSMQHALINGTIMRQKSGFVIDRTSDWLYFINSTESSVYDSLFRVDLKNNSIYSSLASDHYSPFRKWFTMTRDNQTMYAGMGTIDVTNMQLTDTTSLIPGNAVFNSLGSKYAVYTDFNHTVSIRTYDSTTRELLETINVTNTCQMDNDWDYESHFLNLPSDLGWLIWRGDTICVIKKPDFIFANNFD